MKQRLFLTFCILTLQMHSFSQEKTRLVILADMGNEPDEEQQMMHMLLYANEFDLEGLIAVTGKFLRPESKNPYKQTLHPELFHHLIDGYSEVLDNLKGHASGWPDPAYLKSIVASGQTGYGIESTGEGKPSEGSELLLEILQKDDPRPVYIVVNAGSNTLAQALKDLKESIPPHELQRIIQNIRVYENGAQDNAGAWICHEFPAIHWIRSNYQTYCYMGPGIDGAKNNKGSGKELGPHTWKPYAYSGIGQHQWALEHIIGGHGAFGNYYPIRQFPRGGISFLEGGGTAPWLCLLVPGLSDINHPNWGGWSGRFSKEKVADVWSKHSSVNKDEKQFSPFYVFAEVIDSWTDEEESVRYDSSLFAPVFRWRQAFMNDLQGRMDWCKQPHEKANHNPIVSIEGFPKDQVIIHDVKAGKTVSFDASNSTDPDGDQLVYNWWVYEEAGNHSGTMSLSNANTSAVELTIPKDAAGKEIHLILEVKDDSKIVPMYDYQRIVLRID